MRRTVVLLILFSACLAAVVLTGQAQTAQHQQKQPGAAARAATLPTGIDITETREAPFEPKIDGESSRGRLDVVFNAGRHRTGPSPPRGC